MLLEREHLLFEFLELLFGFGSFGDIRHCSFPVLRFQGSRSAARSLSVIAGLSRFNLVIVNIVPPILNRELANFLIHSCNN
jgi:hypothetical protein